MTTPHSPRKKLLAFVGLSTACVVAASTHASLFAMPIHATESASLSVPKAVAEDVRAGAIPIEEVEPLAKRDLGALARWVKEHGHRGSPPEVVSEHGMVGLADKKEKELQQRWRSWFIAVGKKVEEAEIRALRGEKNLASAELDELFQIRDWSTRRQGYCNAALFYACNAAASVSMARAMFEEGALTPKEAEERFSQLGDMRWYDFWATVIQHEDPELAKKLDLPEKMSSQQVLQEKGLAETYQEGVKTEAQKKNVVFSYLIGAIIWSDWDAPAQPNRVDDIVRSGKYGYVDCMRDIPVKGLIRITASGVDPFILRSMILARKQAGRSLSLGEEKLKKEMKNAGIAETHQEVNQTYLTYGREEFLWRIPMGLNDMAGRVSHLFHSSPWTKSAKP